MPDIEDHFADDMLAAFAVSICDVIAAYIFETRSLVQGLEQKRLFSFSEWQQAKAGIAPESVSQLSEKLNAEVMRRWARRYEEIRGGGTIQ